jgi:hypothetical protein
LRCGDAATEATHDNDVSASAASQILFFKMCPWGRSLAVVFR